MICLDFDSILSESESDRSSSSLTVPGEYQTKECECAARGSSLESGTRATSFGALTAQSKLEWGYSAKTALRAISKREMELEIGLFKVLTGTICQWIGGSGIVRLFLGR